MVGSLLSQFYIPLSSPPSRFFCLPSSNPTLPSIPSIDLYAAIQRICVRNPRSMDYLARKKTRFWKTREERTTQDWSTLIVNAPLLTSTSGWLEKPGHSTLT